MPHAAGLFELDLMLLCQGRERFADLGRVLLCTPARHDLARERS